MNPRPLDRKSDAITVASERHTLTRGVSRISLVTLVAVWPPEVAETSVLETEKLTLPVSRKQAT